MIQGNLVQLMSTCIIDRLLMPQKSRASSRFAKLSIAKAA